MSEFSSVVVIQTNEAGQPTNLVAFSEGDTLASSVLPSEAKQVVLAVEDSSASWDAGVDPGTYNDIVEVSSGFKIFSGNSEACTLHLSTVLDTSVGSGLVDVCAYITDEEGNWNSGGSPSAPGFENWNSTYGTVTDTSSDYVNASTVFNQFSGDMQTSTQGISSILDTSTDFPNATNAADIATLQGQVPSATGFGNWNQAYTDVEGFKATSGALAKLNTVDTAQIAAGAITNTEVDANAGIGLGKLANITGPVILGKTTAGAGNITEISKTDAKAFVDVDDLEASSNFPITTLNNDLDVNSNSLTNITSLSGNTLDISATTIIITQPDGAIRLGPDRLTTAIWDKTGVEKSASSYDYSLSAWETVKDNSGSWGGGGGGGSFEGSAIASAISIGNSSSVLISGVDGAAIDLPKNNQVLALDTATERFVYRTVESDLIPTQGLFGDQLANGTVSGNQLADGEIGDAKLANNLSLDSHIAANDIGFNSLRLIGAETLVGNNAGIGGPMDDLTTTEVKTMLGLDPNITVGTTAPTSPSEGDLWYDTTTGVDDLFAYDSGRTKWLSVATRQYYFARNAAATASHAHLGPGSLTYNSASRIGYFIPYDMTIVGYAWNQGTTAGETTDWTHRLQRYNLSTSANSTLLDISPAGTYTRYKDMTLNTDFDADGLLGSNLVAGGSATSVQQQTITVFMKRRTS